MFHINESHSRDETHRVDSYFVIFFIWENTKHTVKSMAFKINSSGPTITLPNPT